MKYFTVSALIISNHYLQCSTIIFPEDQSSVCDDFEECRQPSDCPSVVRDFKEKNIRPKICSFESRSLSVCCKRVRLVEVTPSPVVKTCGQRSTKKVFQFHLRARQADFDLAAFTPFNENEPAIVNGKEVEKNYYPWMAALGSTTSEDGVYNWFCGGSYIGGNLILTAAHCVPSPGSGFSLDIVRLGAHDLSLNNELAADDYRVKDVIVHPDYVSAPEHDIAIIVLKTGESGVTEKAEVSPTCLPSPGDTEKSKPGSVVTVAGWGATMEGGITADRLQEVDIQVTNMTKCREVYNFQANLELGSGIMCAGLSQGGKDACQGDSGGGLLTKDSQTNTWTQVGIVSAGIGCARRDIPGLYTRVESYLNWIQDVQKQEERLLKL